MFLIKIIVTFVALIIAEMKKLARVYSYEYFILIRKSQ